MSCKINSQLIFEKASLLATCCKNNFTLFIPELKRVLCFGSDCRKTRESAFWGLFRKDLPKKFVVVWKEISFQS